MGVVLFTVLIGPAIILVLVILGIFNFARGESAKGYLKLGYVGLFILVGYLSFLADPDWKFGLLGHIGSSPLTTLFYPFIFFRDIPTILQQIVTIIYATVLLLPIWFVYGKKDHSNSTTQ